MSGSLTELLDIDFGPPLHTVVLCGHMHDIEQTMYERYHWNRQQRTQHRQQQQQQEEAQKTAEWERERRERKVADEARKREVERRKQEERQKQEAERESRKQELLKASVAAAHGASDDEADGIGVEPLL